MSAQKRLSKTSSWKWCTKATNTANSQTLSPRGACLKRPVSSAGNIFPSGAKRTYEKNNLWVCGTNGERQRYRYGIFQHTSWREYLSIFHHAPRPVGSALPPPKQRKHARYFAHYPRTVWRRNLGARDGQRRYKRPR